MTIYLHYFFFFFFNDTATTEIYTLSLHDALPIAKYEDRYVIPQAHTELAQRLAELPGTCGLDFEGGPGGCGALPRPAEGINQQFMLTRRGGRPTGRSLPVINTGPRP